MKGERRRPVRKYLRKSHAYQICGKIELFLQETHLIPRNFYLNYDVLYFRADMTTTEFERFEREIVVPENLELFRRFEYSPGYWEVVIYNPIRHNSF